LHESEAGDFLKNVQQLTSGVSKYDADSLKKLIFKHKGLEIDKPNISVQLLFQALVFGNG